MELSRLILNIVPKRTWNSRIPLPLNILAILTAPNAICRNYSASPVTNSGHCFDSAALPPQSRARIIPFCVPSHQDLFLEKVFSALLVSIGISNSAVRAAIRTRRS